MKGVPIPYWERANFGGCAPSGSYRTVPLTLVQRKRFRAAGRRRGGGGAAPWRAQGGAVGERGDGFSENLRKIIHLCS